MRKEIDAYVKTCDSCQKRKILPRKPAGFLNPIESNIKQFTQYIFRKRITNWREMTNLWILTIWYNVGRLCIFQTVQRTNQTAENQLPHHRTIHGRQHNKHYLIAARCTTLHYATQQLFSSRQLYYPSLHDYSTTQRPFSTQLHDYSTTQPYDVLNPDHKKRRS